MADRTGGVMTKRYIARVELHKKGNVAPNYAKLHEEMAKEGFVRTAKFDGAKLELPTGTYIRRGGLTMKRSEALALASSAAKRTGFTFSIVIAETTKSLRGEGLSGG
jgi:hypothetical protein